MKKRRQGTAQPLPYALQLQMRRAQEIGDERQDSAEVICKLAGFTLNEVAGWGFFRLNRFINKLMENTREFYSDREQMEHWVNKRFNDLGFLVSKDGRILCCTDEHGEPVKKRRKSLEK